MAAKKRSKAKASKRTPASSARATPRPAKKAKAAPRKAASGKAASAPEPASPRAKKAKKKASAKPAAAKKVSATALRPPAPAKASAPTSVPTLAEGDKAPSFELPDHAGGTVSSESLAGHPYVLYFYPKDDTPGCTKEACDFRDFGVKFGAARVRILGVSPDSSQSHARFRDKYGLPFTLISDPDKTLAQAYRVWVQKQNYGRQYMGIARSTFLIDGQGTIKKAWRGVRVPGHVEDVLAAL